MRPDETGSNHEINRHNPATNDEVRGILWKEYEAQRNRIGDLLTQRGQLLYWMDRMIAVSDCDGTLRQAAKECAVSLVTSIREIMETE